jgi:hypothetical protein
MSLINRLIDNINNNNSIKIGIAAIMLHGTKPIGDVCGNTNSNYCRGMVCPSVHAEVKAVTTYFGKNINYSPKHGWISSCIKKAEEFKYHGD